jgi:putative FmdB family regulatory protein
MPVYRFHCQECGVEFDLRLAMQQIHERPLCPAGHADVRRLFLPPAVVFKGSGFYVTDQRKTVTPADPSK